MGISVGSSGSFNSSLTFLKKASNSSIYLELNRYGQMGVAALAKATPRDTGLTAESWEYKITKSRTGWAIAWYNENEKDGANVAIMLQYGHGTGTGGYVSGYDYINPAIKPVFDKIADEVWKKVNV